MSRSTDNTPTIRLQNIAAGNTQLNLHLVRMRAKASPGLRRGLLQTPIRILPGLYYDVCKELNVTLEEARRIVESSPEVRAHKNANRLMVREFPVTAEQAAEDQKRAEEAADARRKHAELNPPDPVDAVPAGVDLEAAGLPEDTPRMTKVPGAETDDDTTLDASTEMLSSAADDLSDLAPSAPDEEDDDSEDGTEEEETAEDTARSVTGPTMRWTLDELTAYAQEHDINLGRSTSKTAILKKIRKAMSP